MTPRMDQRPTTTLPPREQAAPSRRRVRHRLPEAEVRRRLAEPNRRAQARRNEAVVCLAMFTVVFALFTGVSFVISAMVGSVKVEAARKERSDIAKRMTLAKQAESQLRSEVILATRSDSVDTWAMRAGMVTIDRLIAAPPTTVARLSPSVPPIRP